uniref:LRR-RLK n=1 Tax=Rhizophora mucronata TaxID=61149 RepID=A0A2P2LBY0_RHIMU
MLNLTHSVILS